ncbi:MAG: hypothetical protein MZV70_02275 [Desulfobacterales bacterium]|nr:hypothetical protein [Desulfobacterales bacterium]
MGGIERVKAGDVLFMPPREKFATDKHDQVSCSVSSQGKKKTVAFAGPGKKSKRRPRRPLSIPSRKAALKQRGLRKSRAKPQRAESKENVFSHMSGRSGNGPYIEKAFRTVPFTDTCTLLS